MLLVTLHVTESYKGSTFEVDAELGLAKQYGVRPAMLITDVHDASCGYPCGRGQQYLVYAWSGDGVLHTSLCGGTDVLSDVGEAEIAALKRLSGKME